MKKIVIIATLMSSGMAFAAAGEEPRQRPNLHELFPTLHGGWPFLHGATNKEKLINALKENLLYIYDPGNPKVMEIQLRHGEGLYGDKIAEVPVFVRKSYAIESPVEPRKPSRRRGGGATKGTRGTRVARGAR